MTSGRYLRRINLSLRTQNVGDCAKPVYAYTYITGTDTDGYG